VSSARSSFSLSFESYRHRTSWGLHACFILETCPVAGQMGDRALNESCNSTYVRILSRCGTLRAGMGLIFSKRPRFPSPVLWWRQPIQFSGTIRVTIEGLSGSSNFPSQAKYVGVSRVVTQGVVSSNSG
jgi:hypothetical protein